MKLSIEQKQANKTARQDARKTAKELARVNAEKNQNPIREIKFSIEWKKSKIWGNNPHLEATAYHKDGTMTYFSSTASGCGYDKESQVISDAFNQFLKYKIYQIDATNKEPYGIYRSNHYKGYSGGIGVNCYYEIADFIGGNFEKVASGKTYDAYKYTDKK